MFVLPRSILFRRPPALPTSERTHRLAHRRHVCTDNHGLSIPCWRPHGAGASWSCALLGTGGEKIFIYGDAPRWLANFPANGLPILRSTRLFKTAGLGIEPLAAESDRNHIPFLQSWTIRASTTEQVIIEALDELPENESFHNIDAIFEGLTTLRPRRMTELLTDCTRVQDEGPTDPLFRTLLVYVASSGRPRTKCWMSGAVPERHPVAP
ncbi:type IV toxin-antitoxin system AbiEi family antitoxin domain-containing protein [Rhizobium mulingense]|uniref:type IV toxin-antitoxin system AbiEi family antitoxin domain-containing protein n=1 Tax=Rhizobium mulingense TaxID=3031128 RepID=UPI002B48C2F7|nr:type IV toxin-antitoxin system AbiEi family antitoxin domain-containing protein [Rhizobium sp. MJ21]MEB3046871.1 type IV toxin-antitoxin system AbiEi family antitoxin domain-containing protein [Rhizobium sp. MJ21]